MKVKSLKIQNFRNISDIFLEFDDEIIETELDSYREWLDKKSRCKKCGLTCYQAQDGKYHCPRCDNFT